MDSQYSSPLPYPLTPSPPVHKIEPHQLVPSNYHHVARALSQPAASPPVRRRGRGRPRAIHHLSPQPPAFDNTVPMSVSTESPPPPTTFESIIPMSMSSDSQLSSPRVPTLTINNTSVQLTGDWAADAHAANECLLHAPVPRRAGVPLLVESEQTVPNVPSTRRHHLTHRLRKAARAQSHPYNSPSTSPVRRSISLSELSRPAKGKKPIIACLFCRGRKIACGAPPPGSTDRTCE